MTQYTFATVTDTQKEDAIPYVEQFLQRNKELEDVLDVIQPLLRTLSERLYPNDEPVMLHRLIADGIDFIKGAKHGNQN